MVLMGVLLAMCRKEASAVHTSLEEEKLAREALRTELESVQTTLSQTETDLRNQRQLAQRIGETAAQV